MPRSTHNSYGQLEEALLTEVNFRRNVGWDPGKGGVTYTVAVRTEAELSDDREQGLVNLHASINFQREGEQTEDPFDLELVVTGIFAWLQPDLPDEEIRGWLAFNGEHLLWPYLRAFVSQITAASGAPPLSIYTIGVPRPHLGRSGPEEEADDAARAEEVGH